MSASKPSLNGGRAARRSYGSGRVYVRTDTGGRETFSIRAPRLQDRPVIAEGSLRASSRDAEAHCKPGSRGASPGRIRSSPRRSAGHHVKSSF